MIEFPSGVTRLCLHEPIVDDNKVEEETEISLVLVTHGGINPRIVIHSTASIIRIADDPNDCT